MKKLINHGMPDTGTRKLFRRVRETKQGAYGQTYITHRNDPTGQTERYTFKAEIDTTDLEAMAHQAAKNKSGKCKDGALLVTITSRAIFGKKIAA